MSFRSSHELPLPDIAELKVSVEGDTSSEAPLSIHTHLRVHQADMQEECGSFVVHVTQATLAVDFFGMEPIEESRLGNDVADAVERIELKQAHASSRSRDEERSGGLKAIANATASGGQLGLEASRSGSTKTGSATTHSQEATTTRTHRRVQAIGNNKWRVTEPNQAPLDSRYVGDQPLCVATPHKGSNRLGVEASLTVLERHLKITTVEEPRAILPARLRTPAQKKLFNILVAKSLHEKVSGKPYSGVLVLAQSQSYDEG